MAISRKIVTIVAVVLVCGFAAYVAKRSRPPGTYPATATGALAPDFSLPQLDGTSLRLSAYRGKVILLDFWATWCAPCLESIPHFVDLQNKYRPKGLQIIGVSMDDSSDPVRDFYQRFKMNYPVVMGNADIGEAYGGVLGLPIAFVLDRNGRIYSKHIGATDNAVLETEILNLLQTP